MDRDKKLKLLMLEKEKRRRQEAKKGEMIREDISSRFVEGAKEVAEDVPIALAQGATASFADELAGGVTAAYKKATGDERPYEELYKETRDIVRGETKRARERSPIATFIAEIAPGLTYGGAGIKRTIGEGLAYGAGESESEDIEGVAIDATLTGAGAGAFHGAGKLGKLPFKKPKTLRARFTGQAPKEFEKRGGRLGDPREMADELNRSDFFKYKSADFDVDKERFIPLGKKAKGAPTREEALQNTERALSKINATVSNLIEKSPKKKSYYAKDLVEYQPLIEDLDEMITKSTKKRKMEKMIQEELEDLQYSIDNPAYMDDLEGGQIASPQGSTLADINREKQNYQREASKLYDSVDPEFKERSAINEVIARNLRKFVNENAGEYSDKIRSLNRVSHQLSNARKGLSPTSAKVEAGGVDADVVNPYANALFQAKVLAEKVGGGDVGMLTRARVGEAAEKIPFRTEAQDLIKVAPSRFLGRELIAPMQPEEEQERIPQSVGNLFEDSQTIPEALVKTPLPRSTDAVLENKAFVLAKTAQQAPEMYDDVKMVLDNHPEKIPELLPVLVKTVPHLFVYDRYNRVDGKIIDPQLQEEARKDTVNRDDISKLEKTEILDELNKTGHFYDY